LFIGYKREKTKIKIATTFRGFVLFHYLKIAGNSKKTLDSGLWYGHYIMNVDTNQPLQQQ